MQTCSIILISCMCCWSSQQRVKVAFTACIGGIGVDTLNVKIGGKAITNGGHLSLCASQDLEIRLPSLHKVLSPSDRSGFIALKVNG